MAGENALSFLLIFVVSFSCSCVAADILSESLEQRIQALEHQGLEQNHLLQQQQNDLNTLKNEHNEYKRRFMQQEKLLNTYMRRVSVLETRAANMEQHRTNGIAVHEESQLGDDEILFEAGREQQQAVDVKDTERTVKSKERIRSAADHVVFQASIQGNGMRNVGLHQKVVFPEVSINIGSGYHNQIGVFIVPKTGMYMLSTSVTVEESTYIEAAIMKNGVSLSKAFSQSDGTHLDQGSVTVIASLNMGDEVWVSSQLAQTANIYGHGTCSFTGYLLYEM